jgi:ubiquinone biosynthesis protein COQ4
MDISTQSPTDPTDPTMMSARERWGRALGALARVMRDPRQTDQVLVFTMHANAGSLPDRIDRFFEDPSGRRLYDEQRAIDTRSIDLTALGQLPHGTLGRAYADFLRERNLSPDVFEAPEGFRDPRMTYVLQRLRQTHDLWHVVTGYETDAPSEVALQAFTFGQLRAPSSLLLAIAGTLRALRGKPTAALHTIRGFFVGARAEKLAAFPWEDHWSTPLAEVRAMLGLPADTAAARRAALAA